MFSHNLIPAILATWAIGAFAQDYTAFPAACSIACASYVENSWLCGKQYPVTTNSTTAFQACFCDVIESAEVSKCATCLNTNNAASAGAIVTKTTELCKNFAQNCVYQCDFTTCAVRDVACQCDKDYLQSIYNCASCNTNNKHGGTQISDYQTLLRSCEAQGLANPNDAAKSTDPLPSPTSMSYVAPSLTGNGVVAPVKTTTTTNAAVVSNSAVASTTHVLPTTMTHSSSVASAVSRATTASATYSLVSTTATGTSNGAGKTSRLERGTVSGAAVFLLSLLTI